MAGGSGWAEEKNRGFRAQEQFLPIHQFYKQYVLHHIYRQCKHRFTSNPLYFLPITLNLHSLVWTYPSWITYHSSKCKWTPTILIKLWDTKTGWTEPYVKSENIKECAALRSEVETFKSDMWSKLFSPHSGCLEHSASSGDGSRHDSGILEAFRLSHGYPRNGSDTDRGDEFNSIVSNKDIVGQMASSCVVLLLFYVVICFMFNISS